jgi:uncharacterized protein (TIGR00251 family)
MICWRVSASEWGWVIAPSVGLRAAMAPTGVTRQGDMTTLTFHVQPRAKTTEIAGWHGDAIKIRLAAPPVDGKANAKLLAFLAEALGLPTSAIRMAGGERGRRKRVQLTGLSEAEALRRLGLSLGKAPP